MEARVRSILTLIRRVPFWAWIILAFIIGFALRGGSETAESHEGHTAPVSTQAEVKEWTCAMHPQIRMPGPGQCPICGMNLIPVQESTGREQLGPRQLKLSDNARILAGIQTAAVGKKALPHQVQMVGKLEFDETRVKHVTAWTGGRLDRLFVDYTGSRVSKGQPLIWIYSPELYAAQQELSQALANRDKFSDSPLESVRKTAATTVQAAREKLKLLGLGESQIAEIEKADVPSTHLTISSPISGTVVNKEALEGMYVSTGTIIYTVADLSRLWLQLEAYESDLPWLAVGQAVKFTTESYPGESFSGTVRFIDPVVDPAKRTVRVRVEVPNANSRLKPDMFARSTVDASPAGIDKSKAPLVIPASAPLITGKRAVVYVEVAGKENVYEGREVVLGPRTGDYYIVRDGLAEGEMVVVNGNFKIDSALQILAKPSMMSPAGGAPAPGHGHAGQQAADPGNSAVEHSAASHQTEPSGQAPLMFREQLTDLYHVYFAMQESLSRDVFNDFSSMVAAFTNALGNVDMTALAGDAHKRWMDSLNRLKEMAAGLAAAGDIEQARTQFASLSDILIEVFKSYGAAGPGPVVFFHCPMAFNNQGASWLQAGGKAANPYLGSKMVGCHDIVDTLYVGQVEMGGGAHE